MLTQTRTHHQAHAPHLKLSTAASAVGAWQSAWWGGNLKGVWSETKRVRSFCAGQGVTTGGLLTACPHYAAVPDHD